MRMRACQLMEAVDPRAGERMHQDKRNETDVRTEDNVNQIRGMGGRDSPDLDDMLRDRTFQNTLNAGVAVLLLVGSILLIQKAWVVFQPLVVAIFMAAALWPWVSRISSARVGPRGLRIPRVMATAFI